MKSDMQICGLMDRFFMVNPLSYFSFQPVLHDWYNKGHGMCYPVCVTDQTASLVEALRFILPEIIRSLAPTATPAVYMAPDPAWLPLWWGGSEM